MGIHYNHKSKSGDRKMEKQYKLKMKSEERKRIREENKLQKEVDRIKWENRERIKPIRNKDK